MQALLTSSALTAKPCVGTAGTNKPLSQQSFLRASCNRKPAVHLRAQLDNKQVGAYT